MTKAEFCRYSAWAALILLATGCGKNRRALEDSELVYNTQEIVFPASKTVQKESVDPILEAAENALGRREIFIPPPAPEPDNGPAALQQFDQTLSSEQDIAIALRMIDKMSPDLLRRELMMSVLGKWVGLNPEAAAAWAVQQPQDPSGDNDRRIRTLECVASKWPLQDPHAALSWMNDLTNPDEKWQVERCIYDSWASSAPEAMAHWLLTNGSSSLAMEGLRNQWVDADPAAAAQWVVSSGKNLNGSDLLLRSAVLKWADEDPKSALQFIVSSAKDSETLTAIAIEKIAEKDPLSALELTENLDGPLKQARIRSSLCELIEQDPEQAYSYFSQLPDDGELKMSLGPDIAGVMGCIDTERAEGIIIWMDLVLQLTLDKKDSERLYEESFVQTLKKWTGQNPILAAQWLEGAGMTPEDTSDLSSVIAKEWAQTDASSAANYLESKSVGEVSENTWIEVTKSLARQNPQQAAKLLDQKDLISDELTQTIVREWSASNPQDAMRWVMKLMDANNRSAGVQALTEEWFKIDPNELINWANTLSVAAEKDQVKRQILKLRHQID